MSLSHVAVPSLVLNELQITRMHTTFAIASIVLFQFSSVKKNIRRILEFVLFA